MNELFTEFVNELFADFCERGFRGFCEREFRRFYERGKGSDCIKKTPIKREDARHLGVWHSYEKVYS